MLTRLDLRGTSDLASVLAREVDDDADVLASVRGIIAAVRERGDVALRELTARFDGATVDDLRVPASELTAALAAASPELRSALEYAADRIRAYHGQQAAQPVVELVRDGIDVHEITLAVDRAGLYVPGGRAAYPSTVLMTAIPARVAGVAEVVLCVPPVWSNTPVPDAPMTDAPNGPVPETVSVPADSV